MKKPCARCGEKFDAHSPATKLCDDCWEEAHIKRRNNKNKKTKK
jgi:rRNA maturation endonuclease Nob1